jgi:transposase
MAYTITLSDADLAFVKEGKRKEKDPKLLRRYQCVSMLHDKYPKKEIAGLLGVNIDTVTDWAKIYNRDGLAGLGLLKYGGRRPSALDKMKDEMDAYIKKENVSKLSQLQAFLEKKHGLKVEHSWLSRYCKKNSISLIKKQG